MWDVRDVALPPFGWLLVVSDALQHLKQCTDRGEKGLVQIWVRGIFFEPRFFSPSSIF